MPARRDPRSVALSFCLYRALLRAYPRRFRQQYREEMALVFRDACRQAHQEEGCRGLVRVWRRGLADLVANVPKEMGVALVDETPVRPCGRSCSGCNNEVAPDWQRCRYCGSFLSSSTTHPTHVVRVRHSFRSGLNAFMEQEMRADLAQLDETLQGLHDLDRS
jgi:hypothetical protein